MLYSCLNQLIRQAEGKLPPGAARRYKSTLDAFATIARTEGIRGLWTVLF
jgi:solute carrier family 25 uncoupling protein 8/9